VRSTFHFSAITFTFSFNSEFISVSADSISFSLNILCVFKVGGRTTKKCTFKQGVHVNRVKTRVKHTNAKIMASSS
jgi:hypothetical protein